MTTVTVTTEAAGSQERPGSPLLAGDWDGGVRICQGAATKAGDEDGDSLFSPKTLPVQQRPALIPAPRVILGGNPGSG